MRSKISSFATEISGQGIWSSLVQMLSTLKPRRNGQHFAGDTFKRIFFNENVWISIKISLTFVPKGPIHNIPALVQIMAWRRPGDKPLSEPMMDSLSTHICVTRPQWDNRQLPELPCTLENIFQWKFIQNNYFEQMYSNMPSITFRQYKFVTSIVDVGDAF